jgi:transcriptional regulator with XRE-family HTH domain
MAQLEAFFRDLRALRAGAGLSLAELAERAHFPEETLTAAEAGPTVPSNPVLVAYVEGCDGPLDEWEDRWRDASAAIVDQFPAEALGLAYVPGIAPPQRRLRRRVAAVAAVALVAGGAAVAVTRPAGHPAASAGRRTSPTASPTGASRPQPVPRHSSRHSATPTHSATPMHSATPTPQMACPGCSALVALFIQGDSWSLMVCPPVCLPRVLEVDPGVSLAEMSLVGAGNGTHRRNRHGKPGIRSC